MSWEVRALGEVCDLYQPKTISRKEMSSAGGFPVYGANGRIGYYHSYNHHDSEVLLSCRGNCGTVNVSEPMSWVNGNAMVCKPKDASLSKDFLAWVLRTVNWDLVITGTAQQQITRAPLSKVLIPVPPLGEQKRIVAQLEDQLGKLEAVRARLKVIRDQLIQLRASGLNESFGAHSFQFGWDSLPLGDVLIPITGKRKTQRGWSPQCESHPASEGLWGVLKTTAVQMGWFEPEQNKALPASLEPKPEVEVSVGDLLLLTTGPRNRCGIPALVEESPGKLMMSGKMIRLRADSEKVLRQWLLLFLLSPHGQSELERLKVGSSDSSVSIGADVLLKVEVPVPTLEHQERVVTDLAVLSETQQSVQAQLDDLEASLDSARSSILHRSFLAPEEAA